MRVTQTFANTVSKQRLRDDIGNHVQDFLDNGGKIEVVSELAVPGTSNRSSWWPAAADAIYLPRMDRD
jgi:hypothetical protein